jgi:MFS transporter, BCD family, chlorophyll transporter
MQKTLSTPRTIKLGLFHLGSALADVLGSGVWNRIMIEELGKAATPVGFLLALRYFMAPLAAWAGERSDYTHFRGYRRLPWVYGGRLGMILGYWLVAFSTVELVRHGDLWWLGIILGFVLASVGQTLSGSTFLALVSDRAPSEQRGRAVGIVWTFLLMGYAVAGVMFARMLPEYSESAFLTFFGVVGLIMGFIWFFTVWGEEQPQSALPTTISNLPKANLMADLRDVLSHRSARMLSFFMLFSFVASFMQDTLLEPLGGSIFDMSVGETTRFQAYWGTMAILSSFAALYFKSRLSGHAYQRFSRWGIQTLIVAFGVLALTAYTQTESVLRPGLLVLGLGYGLWNIGTVGLMVEYSREERAGLDLGLWTVVTTICRGIGVLFGAVLFDLLSLGLDDAAAFGGVFLVEAIFLVISLGFLNQVGRTEVAPIASERELVLGASMD